MKIVYGVGLVAVGALFAAAPVHGQQPDTLQAPAVYFGLQGTYAHPVGEFRDYVKGGGGLSGNVVWPVQRSSPLALRADGGFIVYGSETQEVCFSTTVGCRIRLDLTTTNSIAYLNFGPQLMLPRGSLRPYINGGVGFSYFATTSSVSGTGSSNENIANSTNFDDVTLAWTGGGGLLIALSRGRTPIFLDFGARYYGNGEVEYLKKGDITETPSGITFTPTRSEANLLTFQLGVTVGVRPQSRQ